MTPGFRYAIVYFLCVLCIASVVWWQFNPGNGLVFDPTGDFSNQGAAPQAGDSDSSPEHGEGEEQDAEVFSPQRGDKLILPLKGEILASPGSIFKMFSGMTSAGIDGIHIDGIAGDDVCAAWRGVVETVIVPGPHEIGAVRVKHGGWVTVYKNIENITVKQGQTVQAGEKLGELAANPYIAYSGDYLDFQLWDPDEKPQDPQQYVSVGR